MIYFIFCLILFRLPWSLTLKDTHEIFFDYVILCTLGL